MIRIMIVDDEKLERNGIRFLLKDRTEEIDILEAKNGKEALELLHEEHVDILFTDIKMPFMNGIELVEKARALKPDIEMVIFSGYGEFEYARAAMKYGVDNYVLKPVDPVEFHHTFDKLIGKISNREQMKKDTQETQNYLEKFFLSKYLYQGHEEYLEKVSVNLDNIRGMLLLESDDNFMEEFEDTCEEALKGELRQDLYFINLSQNQELCFVVGKCSMHVLAEHMLEWLEKQYHKSFYIAVSRHVHKHEEVPEIFRELDTLMENKFYRKDTRIFLPEKSIQEVTGEQFLTDILNRMITDIQLDDMIHLWEHFTTLREGAESLRQYSQVYTKFLFSNLVKEILSHQNVTGHRLEESIQNVYEFQTMDEVLALVESLIVEFEKRISENKSGNRDEVERAKSYIYEHYNEEISVEILAELVYLSPGYFSYIFKKETGQNLSRFVRIYRIEKAKELLDTTNMKIVQVCKETGFSNVSYFCKNFREYYGCSPEQFRKGEPINEEVQE